MSDFTSTDATNADSGVVGGASSAGVLYRVGDPAPPPLKPFTEPELVEMWGGKTEPVVSILCPTYNHRDFISNALDGCLGQVTDFPFEVIVRDDGSTDGTADIVREYAARYPNVIRALVEAENTFSKGIGARQAMEPVARGRLIALCDGDDYWIHPDKLTQQVQILLSQRSVAAVHCEACSIQNGNVQDNYVNSPAARQDIAPECLARGVMAMPSTLCFRRTAADLQAEEYGHVANGDNLLFTQLSMHGSSVYLRHVMVAYRIHSGSMWSSRTRQQQTSIMTDSFLWISRYHFRAGSPSIGRRYAVWAGLKIHSRLSTCGPRVATWATMAIAGKWLKSKLLPGRQCQKGSA